MTPKMYKRMSLNLTYINIIDVAKYKYTPKIIFW
jgi:hypothetical protein